MNTLDAVIVLLCLGSAIVGIFAGPLRQIFKLGGLVLGLVLAGRYSAWAQDSMRLRFAHGDAVAYVVVLVGVYVAVRLAGCVVEHWLRGEKLSGAERLTGGIAGLVHGAALSVVAVFVLVAVSPRDAAIFRESKAAPPAIAVGGWVQGVFPKVIRGPFRDKMPGAGTEGERTKDAGKDREKPKGSAPAAPSPDQPKNRSRK